MSIHEINEGDRVKIHNIRSLPEGQTAIVLTSNRKGYKLQLDGSTRKIQLSNQEGVSCLTKLTSAQELGQDSPLPDSGQDSDLSGLSKKTISAIKSSVSDTPEPQSTTTLPIKRGRGRPKKSTSLPPAPPVSPLASKETDEAKTTPEIAYPISKQESSELTPTTGRSKTSPDYSQSTAASTSGFSSSGQMPAGTMSSGLLSQAPTLAAPTLEAGYSYLESPGALGSGTDGTNPPGQNRLEGQLKQIGSIEAGEVSNPEFLEASLGLPVGWTDSQEKRTATELLAAIEPPESAAKPSEISSTPESPSLRSTESSTTTAKRSVKIHQLDLTTNQKWISPELLEEVSFTQIRESVDGEAIARYAELMQSDLWDFEREPLPALFEHENRYLIGDGHHRIEAARKIGADILCEIFTAASPEEALLYSIRAIENSRHGLPLRPKDQRKRIGLFLDLLESGKTAIPLPDGYQEWSARAIATYLRLPESGYRTVATIRRERLRDAIVVEDEPPTTTPKARQKPEEVSNQPAPESELDDRANSSTHPKLDDDQLKELGITTSLDKIVNNVVNSIEKFDTSHLQKIRAAIEVEEERRLRAILEENLESST